MADIEKYQVQFWSPKVNGQSFFYGNGGIVRFPDGQTKIVTAAHVVYNEDGSRRPVTIKKNKQELEIPAPSRRRRHQDTAEYAYPCEDALDVVPFGNMDHRLNLHGHKVFQRFEFSFNPYAVQIYPKSNYWPEYVDGIIVHEVYLQGIDSGHQIFPGLSGSLVVDRCLAVAV
ncbi:MAG TPA: hypothetical protein VF828_05280, partial [Patescibacteria group bacterium]